MGEAVRDKLKLMVVDDESDNLDLLYRTFRREFTVFKADSGVKALQILEQEGEMAIIISDQRMPKMNGTEFLSQTVDRYPDTLRILLTGYTDVEDLVGAINAGKVFKYITKPWNPDELKSVVQQAAETYRVVKQRTNELNRALHRESIFNTITTAIRESLDYGSMLQTVVDAIGQTFGVEACLLYPVEQEGGELTPYHLSLDHVFVYPPITPPIDPPIREGNGDGFDRSYSSNGNGNTVLPLLPVLKPELERQRFTTALESRQIQIITDPKPEHCTQLIIPLTYQQEALAVLALYQQRQEPLWSADDLQLLQEIAKQVALAISQAKLYQRIQQQTEQMRAELVVARQIQMNLLRQSWSTSKEVQVQAHCYPAREVGGDFFEVYVHPQGDIWIAVGDVSGKGVPAALFMASAISLLRRELSQETPPPPNVVLQNLNSSLSDDLVGSNCFITMVLARYSPATHELIYANAGHIYPIVWSRRSLAVATGRSSSPEPDEPNYLKVRGVPLGILPVWQADAGHFLLEPGEVLLLTSDGITEATITNFSTNGQSSSAMLKQSGLWKLLAQQQGTLNLSELLAQIQAYNPIQEDDQTMLSLEVL